MIPNSTYRENIILKLGAILLTKTVVNTVEIGKQLQKTGIDEALSGGFWLYDYVTHDCYFSDKFIASLGYGREEVSNTVDFFYKTADKAHLTKGFDMIEDLINETSELVFINRLDFYTKSGEILDIECTGTVIYSFGKPIMVVGTHDIET